MVSWAIGLYPYQFPAFHLTTLRSWFYYCLIYVCCTFYAPPSVCVWAVTSDAPGPWRWRLLRHRWVERRRWGHCWQYRTTSHDAAPFDRPIYTYTLCTMLQHTRSVKHIFLRRKARSRRKRRNNRNARIYTASIDLLSSGLLSSRFGHCIAFVGCVRCVCVLVGQKRKNVILPGPSSARQTPQLVGKDSLHLYKTSSPISAFGLQFRHVGLTNEPRRQITG